jgi:hypothetical protein
MKSISLKLNNAVLFQCVIIILGGENMKILFAKLKCLLLGHDKPITVLNGALIELKCSRCEQTILRSKHIELNK